MTTILTKLSGRLGLRPPYTWPSHRTRAPLNKLYGSSFFGLLRIALAVIVTPSVCAPNSSTTFGSISRGTVIGFDTFHSAIRKIAKISSANQYASASPSLYKISAALGLCRNKSIVASISCWLPKWSERGKCCIRRASSSFSASAARRRWVSKFISTFCCVDLASAAAF